MSIFFNLDERSIDFDKPELLVKDEFRKYFGGPENRPFLLSELCVLDMLYTLEKMQDGYYKKCLVLKGGHSVRSLVSLIDHRFSFDTDYNLNSPDGYTYGDVVDLKKHLHQYGSQKSCGTRIEVTQNNAMLYFLQINYHLGLNDINKNLVEKPKIEICKTCRTRKKPEMGEIQTMIDLDLLGLKPPQLFHLSLEEQLADKLRVIGATGRQRNNFDAYDVQRICNYNVDSIDWNLTKEIFTEMVEKSGKKTSKYIEECKGHLHSMLSNKNKKQNLENVMFNSEEFNFESMIENVKSVYDFRGIS